MWSRFHNLYSNICAIFKIFCQPNSRKVTPTQFLNQYISIYQNLANMAGMISSNFIILNALIFTMILIIKFFYPLSKILRLLALLLIIEWYNLDILIININRLIILFLLLIRTSLVLVIITIILKSFIYI